MLLKKHQDELNAKKQELAALQRKEGGNLNSRDYTDDIYQSAELNKSVFVEGKMEGSDMFTNLLVVCQRAKFQLFYDELNSLMTDYYENLDKNEQKRITDQAQSRLDELRVQGGEAWQKFIEHYKLETEYRDYQATQEKAKGKDEKVAHDAAA